MLAWGGPLALIRRQKPEDKTNMPDSDRRNIFGMAMTVGYIRGYAYGASVARKLCEGISKGFGSDGTDGLELYGYFSRESHPEAVTTFSETPYSTYEAEVKGIIEDFGLNLDDDSNQILAIAAQAMLFAYNVNSAITLTEFQKLMGDVLNEVSNTFLGQYAFELTGDDPPVAITPFLSSDLVKRLLQYSYGVTLAALSVYPQDIEAQIVNYNWYDVTKVLHGPNLQVMKDVENQYYYLSGILKYEGMVGTVNTCIEDVVTISTWSGDSTYTYYRNTPCHRADSYIGPVDYVTFNRIFNDGPASSGHFDTGIEAFYIDNDREMLETGDWASNCYTLSGVTGDLLVANVFVDANGRYDLLNGEYNAVPRTYDCDVAYQSMHIGNNRPRLICEPPPASCATCVETVITGFKYASLEVPLESWSYDVQFRQTNPISETGRIYKRAWAVSDNPYLATASGGVLWPYTYTEGPYTEYWYAGAPALNGTNELCQLGFFQTFRSPTFGKYPSLVIYPVLAKGAGVTSEGEGSSRTYTFGSGFLYSGNASDVPIKVNVDISSNLSGRDITTQKFFGMGNAFSGQYEMTLRAEENAGFYYTGFAVKSGEEYINAQTLVDAYTGKVIGQYKTMKYISGYRRISDGSYFSPSNKYATNSSGDLFTYAYFKYESPYYIPDNNWAYWCPVPAALENEAFERVYGEQTVESYFPRFYDGPFSVETRTFLYPQARLGDARYQGKTQGVPAFITFRVNIREEVVRELYGRYVIYSDGTISSTPEYRPVIRSDVQGARLGNPTMTEIFKPNDYNASFDYDFNFWEVDYGESTGRWISTSAAIGDWVDNSWAPLMSGQWVPLNRNNNVFDEIWPVENSMGRGLIKNKQGTQTHVIAGPGGSYTVKYSANPSSHGLFHAYRGISLTGELAYVLPLYDLSINSLNLNDGYQRAMKVVMDRLGLHFSRENGRELTLETGMDPVFFEYMGGRRGVTAAQEGGYHSEGFIGDRWNGAVYDVIGTSPKYCTPPLASKQVEIEWRAPAYDSRFIVFNSDISGSDLWCQGLWYNPFQIVRPTGNISSSTVIPYESDTGQGNLDLVQSGEFVNFDIRQYFPSRLRTGVLWSDDEWYYSSGFFIGPCDRDIEVGISYGQRILATSDFYVNDEQLSHYFYDTADCDRQYAVDIGRGMTIEPSEPFYNRRRDGYTIITVIPSGTRAKFNVKSVLPEFPSNPLDEAVEVIGISGTGCWLSLRTHVPLYADNFEPDIHSGDYGWLTKEYFVSHSTPHKIRIPHDGFENLQGVHEFTTFSRSGKLYPRPNEAEFAALATYDIYGNPTYAPTTTVEQYWRNYAMTHKTNVTFSGYREGCRVSFEFSEISLNYDVPPYQTYQLVVPSGKCTLSGRMAYYGQADNCLFTEGFHAVNATEDDPFADLYNPEYVSDVLTRFTGIGLFTWPTGTHTYPVLKAPSVMKQREEELTISVGQNYVYLLKEAPYNYNKLLWPALSDLETMNPGETLEAIPPGDGNTFTASTVMFSAAQGQGLPNGESNPNIVKSYYIQDIFQIYDSVATDAYINSGYCITSGRGTRVRLSQADLSGALVPEGTPLSFIAKGLA